MGGTASARDDHLHGLRCQYPIYETIAHPFNTSMSLVVIHIFASARKPVSFRNGCRLLVIWHSIMAVSTSSDPIKKKPTSPLQLSELNLVPSSTRLREQRQAQ